MRRRMNPEYLLTSTSTVPLFFGLVATGELRGTKFEQTLLERTVEMGRSRRAIGSLLGNTCVRLSQGSLYAFPLFSEPAC